MAAPTTFSGRAYGTDYGGLMTDMLEIVPDLWFPQSVWVYSKMQHDPQIRGILAAYTLPIRRADWRVDPAGCRPEVARLVADDVGLPLLGEDPDPKGARRRGVVWGEHLRLAVQGHLVYGFYPFEKRYDLSSGQARLVELAERVPASVVKIVTDAQGGLVSCQQDTSKSKPIPRSSLVWYANEREGAQWSGKSMLRSAYGPWLLKHETWRVHATSIRRFGMGIPTVEAPVGGAPAQVLEAQRLASAMRAGETAGVGLPAGFVHKLTGLTGSVPDALAFIRYLDQQMATMAIAGVLDLGSTPNGSRALGDVFMDLLQYAVQSVGDSVAATATSDIAVQLVDYNFGEDEPAPRIVCGDVGAEREVTIEALQILLDSGALSPDPELEAYLRSKYNLPERDVPTPPAVVPVPPASDISAPVSAARRGGQPVRAATGLRRDPTPVEAAAKTDFGKVGEQWQAALDGLAAEWGPITDAQTADLLRQVEAAVKAGDIAALSRLSVDSSDAADLLESAMLDAADEAAQTQADEAKAQGVTVKPGAPDAGRVSAQAVALAAMLGSGLAIAAGRKAMQAYTPGASAAAVSAAVSEYVGSLTDASLRDTLGAGVSFGQSAGRIATLQAAPAAARYAASEILDANTCDSCAAEDGYEFADLAEAEDAYASGGYVGCEGGLRCRGIIVTIWDDSALSQAA